MRSRSARWALPAVLALAATAGAGLAQAPETATTPKPEGEELRRAVLIQTGDAICYWQAATYAWNSTTRYEITLPEVSGPVTSDGTFSITFTQGHPGSLGTKTGTAGMKGTVTEDDALDFTSWWNDPIGQGVEKARIALEPGAEVTRTWTETAPGSGGGPCHFTTTWRVDFEWPKRVYDITWKGTRALENIHTYPAFDPAREEWIRLEHRFGFTFTYDLVARVTLERRKGAWEFKSASVTRADAKADYAQDPELYRVVSSRCENCDRVRALVGTSLEGAARPGAVQVRWPRALEPVATVKAVFAYQCAEGPDQAACERGRRVTSDYSDQDGEFLERANRLWVPLVDLPPVHTEFFTTPTTTKSLKMDFRVKRVE